MENLNNRFILRRITKTADDDYPAVIRIYLEATPLEIRTNSNEFSHWLNKKDDTSAFEMMLFSLSLDDVIVGFVQLTYIPRQQIVILDYISLKEPYRVNAVFLVFFSMLQNYLSALNIPIAFYIAEISKKDNGKSVDRESTFYKRVVCLEGFGEVHSKYYNMPLGLGNYESDFEALMFIKSNDSIKYINKDTFLEIVHSICFDYYFSWYKEFLDTNESEQYIAKLVARYAEAKKDCADKQRLDVIYPQCSLFMHENIEKTSGAIPVSKTSSVKRMPLYIAIILVCPLLLIALYSYTLQLIGVQFTAASTFIGSFIGALITSLTAYFVGRRT